MPGVLVDTSALIALLDRDDARHDRSVAALEQVRGPLSTVWPALTEAMRLLAETPRATPVLCDMVSDEALGLLDLDAADMARMKALMQKYRDLPMDFADAALVREVEPLSANPRTPNQLIPAARPSACRPAGAGECGRPTGLLRGCS